jgi:hypothetical protein
MTSQEGTTMTARQPKGSDGLLTLSQARRQIGCSQVELLHLVVELGVVPVRQRRGSSLWYLRSADVRWIRLERLSRLGIPNCD